MSRRVRHGLLRISSMGISSMGIASLIGAAAFLWPFFIPAHQNVISNSLAKMFSLVFVMIALAQVFFSINASLVDSKIVALLGILIALDAALRLMGAGAIGIEPMWFLLILASYVVGPMFGFALGSLSMAASALITGGIGPWLPFQMFAAAWIGSGAGALSLLRLNEKNPRMERWLLALYGICAAEFFGMIMDLQLWPWLLNTDTQLSYQPGASIASNVHRFIIFHFATSMAWNIPRAIVTAGLILFSSHAILTALRRAQVKLTLPVMGQTAAIQLRKN